MALGFRITRPRRLAAIAAVGLAAAVLGTSSASAAVRTVDLCARPGTATLTGITQVPIWGFGIPSTAGDCSTATPSLPGPLITVDQGDTVTLHVVNQLPAAAAPLDHAVRLEIPGITFDPGSATAPRGGDVTVTFTASAPGTYLYSSGGDAGRQLAMGLAGLLVVRPAGAPGQAYAAASTAFDVEAPVVLGAVDPAFNAAPDSFDLHTYNATYWLINGKAYPDTAGITAAAGKRVLLRYANAGFDNTSMMLLGLHEQVVGRSARALLAPVSATTEIIAAGATEDAVAVVPATPPPGPNGFAIYGQQLHLTNGPQTSTPAAGQVGPGGMLTFLHS
jgi:FtsP/CotA-like multicopper oxidase with cupredoxin domain